MGEVLKGFTIYAKRKDIFIETNRTRKTKSLAKKIIRAMNGTGEFDIPDNAAGIDAVITNLQKATIEKAKTSTGMEYYKLNGENFAMTTFPEDVIVIRLEENR